MATKKEKKLYTESDLVSFGQHLLSKEREDKIKKEQIASLGDTGIETAHEIFRSVTASAVYNWKEKRSAEMH